MEKSYNSKMKLGAPIFMVLLVVTLIELQPLVAADSDAEMGNCTSVVTLALFPCLVARSSISFSRISCRQFRALDSSQVSGNRGETCLCYLLRNPSKFGFDEKRIASLMAMCHMKKNSKTSLCEGHGGTNSKSAKPLRNSASAKSAIRSPNGKSAITSPNGTVRTPPILNFTPMFIWSLAAFLFSSVIPIYDIFRNRKPREVPTLTIDNMFAFILATWYGLNAGDKFSRKISYMNGMQAVLELIHSGTCVYRNRDLWKPIRDRFGKVAIPFFLCFGFIQYTAEPIHRKNLFAVCSTIASVITLIRPFITLSKELRDSRNKPIAFGMRTLLQMAGNAFWLCEGIAMGDVSTEITSSAGLLANFVRLIMLEEFQIKKRVEDESLRAKTRATFLTGLAAAKWLRKLRKRRIGAKKWTTFLTGLAAPNWLRKLWIKYKEG